MSEIIPEKNLPIYLEQYAVTVLNNEIDKIDFESEIKLYGSVLFSTVGILPTNIRNNRVWNFNINGRLKPDADTYYIYYDFTNVDYKYESDITFQDKLSGTLTICGKVFDASKILNYKYSFQDKLVKSITVILDKNKLNMCFKKEVSFSYNININDNVYGTSCSVDSSSNTITIDYYNSCEGIIDRGSPLRFVYIKYNYLGFFGGTPNTTYTVNVSGLVGYCIMRMSVEYTTNAPKGPTSDTSGTVTINIYQCDASGNPCDSTPYATLPKGEAYAITGNCSYSVPL